jgi:hypothetical protein
MGASSLRPWFGCSTKKSGRDHRTWTSRRRLGCRLHSAVSKRAPLLSLRRTRGLRASRSGPSPAGSRRAGPPPLPSPGGSRRPKRSRAWPRAALRRCEGAAPGQGAGGVLDGPPARPDEGSNRAGVDRIARGPPRFQALMTNRRLLARPNPAQLAARLGTCQRAGATAPDELERIPSRNDAHTTSPDMRPHRNDRAGFRPRDLAPSAPPSLRFRRRESRRGLPPGVRVVAAWSEGPRPARGGGPAPPMGCARVFPR